MAIKKQFKCEICHRTTTGNLNDTFCSICKQDPEKAEVKRNKQVFIVSLLWSLAWFLIGSCEHSFILGFIGWISTMFVLSL